MAGPAAANTTGGVNGVTGETEGAAKAIHIPTTVVPSVRAADWRRYRVRTDALLRTPTPARFRLSGEASNRR